MCMRKLIMMGFVALCLGVAACSSSKAKSSSDSFINFVSSSNEVITAGKTYVLKTISVNNFNAIENIGSCTVEYKYGRKPHVDMYLPDNILPYVEAKVDNGQLNIKLKDNVSIRWGKDSKAKITVYSPSVRNFSLIGSGDLIVKEELTGEDSYKFQLTGSGDLLVRSVKAAQGVTAKISGSGDLAIQNITTENDGNVKLTLAGSGDLNVTQLTSGSVAASVAGSGDLNVYGISARKTTGSVAGSGDMRLKGTTNAASLSVAGSGDLSAGGLKAKDVNASAFGTGDLTCYATGKTHFSSSFTSSIRNVAPKK